MITLRQYQQECINTILNKKDGKYLIQLATGLGKTIIFTQLINYIKGRVLILSHRQELVFQPLKYISCSKSAEIGKYKSNGEKVISSSVQTFIKRYKNFKKDDFEVIIIDECFPAETIIDGKHIEDLKRGDIITSYNHDLKKIEKKKILKTFKSIPKKIVTVKLSNRKEIVCTAGHPFYTKDGYIPAYKLTNNHEVLYMWKRNINSNKISKIQIQKNRACLLFKGMFKRILSKNFFRNNDKNKSKIFFRSNEKKQSNEKKRNTRKSFKKIKRNRSLSKNKMWKWSRVNRTTTKFINCIKRFKPLCRISNTNKNEKRHWLSNLLQNRYSFTSSNVSYRNRWYKSLFIRKTKSRQKENTIFEWVRVDCITIQKQTSDGTFSGLCKNGYVYNIEVEDNNNYFVDNILVHNCHHSAAKTYKEIINYFTPNKLLGFSATPNRGDKVRLDNIFDEIIFERPLKWGILNNFLCGIECKSIDIGYDLTNIKTSKGDYQQKELESTVNIDSANEVIAEAYLKYAKGQTVIFGVSVNHCYEIQKLIKDSQVVDGKTNKEKRKQLIEDFTNRKFNCLINCLVFTEGTDMPLIETIIIARPTQNESLYTQMVGRGLRLYEGKNKLLLIDCVGASNNDLCVAPTLFGLNIHETNMTVNEIEGDLFDLSDFIMDEIENPKTWIKNIKNINIFKKKSGYDMHNVNYFLKPDGSFTLSFPGFNKTIPAADKLGYIQAKNGKMKLQDAFDIMYNYLVKNHQEKSQLWDLNKIKQWGKHRATEQQLYLIEKYYPDYPAYLLNKMEAFILINKAKGAY